MPKHGQFAIIPARTLYDTRLESEHRDTLSVLGLFADKNGWCWPKLRTVATVLKVSTSFVSKRIAHLEKCGYVLVQPQYDHETRARIHNKYRILYDSELPAEFDRSQQAESTPFPDDEEPGKTPFPEDTGDGKAPFLNHTGMEQAERPSRTPQENGEGEQKPLAHPDKEERSQENSSVSTRKRQIKDAVEGWAAREGQPVPDGAAIADPRAERRAYRERVGAAFATVFRHDGPSQNDKSAAGKLFDLHFPIARSLQFLEHAANGGGERYRTGTTKDGKGLTAYHVIGDMDDWRKSGYPVFYSRDDVTQASLSMLPNLGAG